jgi:PAS domain S-box-containing protein
MINLLSSARTALGADALCLWRVDASGAALPVLCTPEGWLTAAFAAPAADEPAIVLASGEAAATLLPEELRLSRNVAPGAVLRASGTTRGLVSLWESGRTPPPDASRTAQALLEQWAVLDHECALSQERDQVRLQMEGLFLAMPQGVIRLPEAQHPGLVNEAAALLLGVPIGEIAEPELAAALTRLIERSEEPMNLREGLSAARHSGAPPREFTVHLREPGMSLRITVLPSPAGRSPDGIWLINDVTRLELYERRLRLAVEKKHAQLSETLEVAIDAARLGPWSWYPDEGRLVWSDACKALFAFPASEEVDYARFIGAIHPDDRDRVQAGVARAISGGGDFDQEYRVIWPDGSEHWVNSLARVFYQPDGSLERFEGVAQDITARRESEQRLRDHVAALDRSKREIEALNVELGRRAREAETAIRARDAFMRNVSHEFRTPLNHILGGAELLLADDITPHQGTWLCRIRDAARSLNRMVDDVLDLASLSAGSVTLESKPFSPASLARDMISRFSAQATAKGLDLSARVSPELPAVLMGDAMRISRLIEVYLGNAVKFSERGSVVLEFGLQGDDPEGVVLRCTVSDTGPGIDPGASDRIFEAFEQGDASLTRRHGGVGLGLSSVRSLASLFGGETGVDSAPGAGSRFWFTAHLARPADTGMPLPASAKSPGLVLTMPIEPVSPDVRAEARAILGDLDGLLAVDDMRAAGVLRANAEPLRRAVGKEALACLSAAVDIFDFATARTLTRQLLESVRAA